jgi:uncharacterized protein YqfA (UPF0365 family)
MKPTSISGLGKLFFLTAWISGVLVHVLRVQFQFYLQVPLNLFVATISMTIAIGTWTILARKRISGPTKTFNPLQSARTAALALAGSHTGTIIAAVASGLAVAYLVAPSTVANTERIQILSATAIAGLLLVFASLWLERICKVPDSKDDK